LGGDGPSRRILLTGASGFIGGHLLPLLESSGMTVVTLARDGIGVETLTVDSESLLEDWTAALSGVDAVIHLAAIAHQIPEPEALARVNVRWPVRMFEAAAKAGVQDFVFLSSIKVFGDRSERPFQVEDPYAPEDVYGESKVDAERALVALRAEHPGIRLSILRPPLVYGPGVKANFRTLLSWAARGNRGWPLPFGAARAPRSLISVQNLCEAVVACLGRSGTFHCADPSDLSVADVFRRLGVPPSRLLAVPAGLMRPLLTVSGFGAYYPRLYESLQLETEASNAALGWSPQHTSEECLAATMAWWLE
jgi:nucleoside-diphosphate-sugar epimerase